MIRFASLDEAWGMAPIAPHIENPYKQEPYKHIKPTPPVVLADACHKHILDVYETEGIDGVLRSIPSDIVWQIQARGREHLRPSRPPLPPMPFGLSVEETLLLAIGAFAFLMALDS
jgi:hypothetical protein